MANTTTGSLADSQQFIIDSARPTREYNSVHMKTTDAVTLKNNEGLDWDEITVSQLTAQGISESTILDNPQEFTDSLLSLRPTMAGLNYVITDQVFKKLSSKTVALLGPQGQLAIERKKEQDYLAIAATASTTLAGTGQTLVSGHLRAGRTRIKSNASEPGRDPIVAVLHGYGVKMLGDEVLAGIGTYTIPEGTTANVYMNGYMGSLKLDGTQIWQADNIAINSTPDARGMIHAKDAVIYVQAMKGRAVTRRREEIGGGADEMFHYDDYIFGKRGGGNWLYGLLHGASAPSN